MSIYIINYKSDDDIKRKKRNIIHQNQIEWYLTHTDLDIEIVAMNYVKDDFINHPRIKYFVHKERALANEVRALYFQERFYKQEAPWAVFSDDDTWLYSESWEKHCDGATFIKDICKNPAKFDETPIIWPAKPEEHPYQHKIKPNLFKENYVFERTKMAKTSFCIVRKRKDIVFWESDPKKYVGEEIQFCYDNFIAGIPSYTCHNIGKKHMDGTNRSWLDNIDIINTNENSLFEIKQEYNKVQKCILMSENILEEKYKKYNLLVNNKKHTLGSINQFINFHCKFKTIPKG